MSDTSGFYLGCSLRPKAFATLNPPITTQSGADNYWTTAAPNGLGLPLQASKVFYPGTGSSNWPTTLGGLEQTFVNDGVAIYAVVYPTYPFVAAEVTALTNYVKMITGAGGTVAGVMLGNEVNSGRTYTATQYGTLVNSFQAIRSYAPIVFSASGSNQDSQAAWFSAASTGNHDGITVDYYDGAYQFHKTLTNAATLADGANIWLGLGEMGNNVDGPGITTNFTNYMTYLQTFFAARNAANKPMGPFMWYQGDGPNSGGSWITSPTDPRIAIIKKFQAAVTPASSSSNGPYDVGSFSTSATGTTLTLTVGTGSLGSPSGTSAGDLVYVLISATNSSQTIVSVVDSKGNTYTPQNSYAAGSSQNQWLYASKTTAALVAGTDTITVTYGTSTGNKSMIVRGCPGVTSVTADKAIVNNGNSTAPNSGASGTLTNSSELVVGSISDGGTAGKPTNPSFGAVEALVQGNNLSIFDEQVTSTSGATASATLPGSGGAWSAMVTTFLQGGPTITTPASLTEGFVGSVYSATETAKGGTRPYTWQTTAVTGAFPPGLTFSAAGVFSGTPTTAGTYTFTVKVTAGGGNSTTSSTQTIVIAAAAPAVTTGALVAGTVNVAYSASETASGGTSPFTWVVTPGSGSLPPGVALSSAGAFSGTPTTAGTYTFTVTATDVNGAQVTSSTQTITINPAGSTSTAIAAIVIDTNNALQTGHDRAVIAHGSSAAPSVASGTLAQAEEECIGWIADTTTGGTPTWGAPFASNVLANQADGGSHLAISAAFDGVNATTSVTAAGTIVSAPWTAAIVTEPVAPPFSSFALSDGIVGEAYTQTLEASGGIGTITWTRIGSGVPGLSLAGAVYSGTPTTPGTYNFTMRATDANGVIFNVPQTVMVLPATSPSVATAQPMGTNLLSQADSDFESGVGTWTATTNASSVTTSANEALTGSHSLRWSATADGATTVTSGQYTGIVAGKPYLISAYLLSLSNQAPNLIIGINWYTAGGAFISSSNNGGMPAQSSAWQGVQLATVAPPTAAKASVFLEVDTANAGDTEYADLAFLTQANTQVLIDFVNPAFGVASLAGNNFMDASPWVRMDTGINTSSGRQDAISEISTGQANFPLENDLGWFTENNQNTLATAMGGKVTLQSRCQINMADQNGVWYTRYDGQLSNIGYSVDPTGNTNIATLYVADVLAQLSRQDSLQCWTKEQVLANNPSLHWSLDDTPNPSSEVYTLATESSGNSGPPLKLVRSAQANTATIQWNNTTGGVEILADAFAPNEPDGSQFWPAGARLPTSLLRGIGSGNIGPFSTPISNVYFTPVLAPGTIKNQFTSNTGYHLQAQLPSLLNPNATPTGDFSVEAWFCMDPAVATNVGSNLGPYTVFSLGSSRRNGPTIVCGVFQPASGNIPAAGMALYAGPPAFGPANFNNLSASSFASAYAALPEPDTTQIPHHLVLTVTGDPSQPTAVVYVDGVSMGSFPLPSGTTFDTITVGGAYGTAGCFFGAISMVSVYPYALSQSQIILGCQLGQYGMWEAPTDDCIAQLGTYANIPPFWNNVTSQHNGCSLTDYFSISGSNAYTAMTTYEQTENGLLFVNTLGQLSFQTRDQRMGYGAPKLTLPPDSYSEQLGLQVIDTFQVNEDAVASNALPGGASFVNQASQNMYGTYATNPVGSPTQLAHISYSRGYGFAGLQENTFWPDPNMTDAAAWPANSRPDPWFAPGSVTIDLLTMDPTWGINVSDLYGLQIGDVVALGGTLPVSFPNASHSNEFFIEGIAEVNSLNARTITFFLSPAFTQRAWIPGDATYGVLSSTARLGISAADTSTPQADGKDVSHDGGPPYWAPSFSATMNSPAGTKGFVGMNDMRGLVWPLQQMLQPPIAVVSSINQTQSVPNGGNDTPQLFWDTLSADSINGMGILPGYPNWYVCLQAGFYEIDGGAVYATAASGGGSGMMGWIVVAENAAQAVVSGLGTPATVNQYVCPIGESVRQNTVSQNAVASPTTRLYLGLGDMVTIAAEQDTGASVNTAITDGGSRMSIRFVGLGTADDRAQINSSINNGGSVTTPSKVTHGTKTYQVQHTFAHYGYSSRNAYLIRNKDGPVYTGCPQGNQTSSWTKLGSMYTLLRFPFAQMTTDLAGKTILAVSLHGTNTISGMDTGTTLLGGYYYTNNEGSSWQPNAQNPGPQKDLWTQAFKPGQSLTFSIPAAQFQQMFLSNGAHGIILGDNATTSQGNYGAYSGGPNSWTLRVTY